jgi:hypothetical protein
MKLAQLTAPVNEVGSHLPPIYSVLQGGEKLSNHGIMKNSRCWPGKLGTALCIAALLALITAGTSIVQGKENADQTRPDSSASTRLHVEVTGGDPSTPVDSASVYVRYLVKHRIGKDETIEMNLKTNHDGTVVVPYVPRGEVTVQIVAEHWKPFGQKFQLTEDEQTIKIHLEKPPKWY